MLAAASSCLKGKLHVIFVAVGMGNCGCLSEKFSAKPRLDVTQR